jgi:prevent-host-death family protein
MKRSTAIRVGVRDLKNRLTSYLKLAKANREVIVTERGKPIAVIRPIGSTGVPQSLEARIAALASRGEISAPEGSLLSRVRRIRVSGRPLSEEIVAERTAAEKEGFRTLDVRR